MYTYIYTYIALQNLFSYWPELKVTINPTSIMVPDSPSPAITGKKSSTGTHNCNIHVRLYWPYKHRTFKLFREPYYFVPNINAL